MKKYIQATLLVFAIASIDESLAMSSMRGPRWTYEQERARAWEGFQTALRETSHLSAEQVEAKKAVFDDSPQKLINLIQSGLNVNASYEHGCTLLYLAIVNRKFEAAKLLLENKADPHGIYGMQTLLTRAMDKNAPLDICQMLIEKGVPVDAPSGHTSALHYAAEQGNLKGVRLLLKNSASPNPRDWKGDTPLHRAASFKRKEILARDKNPDYINALKRHIEICRLLLTHGANPLEKNRGKETPRAQAECREISTLLEQAELDASESLE